MKEKALKTLQRITSLLDEAFRGFGRRPWGGARERQISSSIHGMVP